MEKDKLSNKDIRFFIIPFLVLLVIFACITYINTRRRVEASYDMVERATLNITDSYSTMLVDGRVALDIINELLNEKLMVASRALLFIDEKEDNIMLAELANLLEIDEIYLYNQAGEIAYSNVEKYIGWEAYEGHPVHDFMTGDQAILVEDIRQDTVSGIHYKYAYIKDLNTNTIIQISVLADTIYTFVEKFQLEQMIDVIAGRDDILYAFFTDTNMNQVACSESDFTEIIDPEHLEESMALGRPKTVRVMVNNISTLHVCAPVYYNNRLLGVLSIYWRADTLDQEIGSIVKNNMITFVITAFTMGAILYYAYRKNKSNIKIAYYDKLTGLPNNQYLQEYLDYSIRDAGKSNKAILLLNCTNFKTINMTYGFKYGDQILIQIADKVKKTLNQDDMFFRFNADRFVLFIENYTDSDELVKRARNLINIFTEPVADKVKYENINTEIAILEVSRRYLSVDKILQDSSLALTYLNRDSNEQIIFFNEQMEIDLQREDKIEKALRAIIKGENEDSFFLVFQPILKVNNNYLAGFEALARMDIEGIGPVSPLEFIGIAEKRALIYDLGNLILFKACQFLGCLRQKGFKHVIVAVNISSIQLLREDFIETVEKIGAQTGIDLSCLEFEVTESVMIDNFDLINEELEDIKKMGISIALDDFGTGFSSFARLRELNIDTIKIDKSFIDRVDDKEDVDLLSADIISMAHKIGLTVVAEGVEREGQMQYLNKHECDFVQGYFISRPLSQDDALGFFKNYQA